MIMSTPIFVTDEKTVKMMPMRGTLLPSKTMHLFIEACQETLGNSYHIEFHANGSGEVTVIATARNTVEYK